MADDGIVCRTTLRQVFPKTEMIEAGNVHNLEIRIQRRLVTRIGGRLEPDQITTTSESEEKIYIPPSIFRCFDELVTELNRTLCGRLNLNLDVGSVNGLADMVFCNLRRGVCDEVQHTVIVVIVRDEEVVDLPGDHVEEVQDLPGDYVEDDYEAVDDDYDYPEPEEYEYVDTEVEVVTKGIMFLDIDIGSQDFNDPCAICWNMFAAGTGASKLPCGHLFHVACIGDWFARKSNCPICRRQIKVD